MTTSVVAVGSPGPLEPLVSLLDAWSLLVPAKRINSDYLGILHQPLHSFSLECELLLMRIHIGLGQRKDNAVTALIKDLYCSLH